MSFISEIKKRPMSAEEALKDRYVQVMANIAYDQAEIHRLRERTQLRTASDMKRYRRLSERQKEEWIRRDEIAKIASLCEINLR